MTVCDRFDESCHNMPPSNTPMSSNVIMSVQMEGCLKNDFMRGYLPLIYFHHIVLVVKSQGLVLDFSSK